MIWIYMVTADAVQMRVGESDNINKSSHLKNVYTK
ncbi:hypothetical protein BN3590_00794 [Clostridium sp. C105KSO15]|nr:hypothetical protein BN3590_00794 [Clostridium sp. C105KSO15]